MACNEDRDCEQVATDCHLVARTNPASSKSRHMLEFLTGFKINDEPSDTVLVNVIAAMAEVPQNRRSIRTPGRGTHLGYEPWLFLQLNGIWIGCCVVRPRARLHIKFVRPTT